MTEPKTMRSDELCSAEYYQAELAKADQQCIELNNALAAQSALVERLVGVIQSVLCDPEGKACFDGSDADRAVIDEALANLPERFR